MWSPHPSLLSILQLGDGQSGTRQCFVAFQANTYDYTRPQAFCQTLSNSILKYGYQLPLRSCLPGVSTAGAVRCGLSKTYIQTSHQTPGSGGKEDTVFLWIQHIHLLSDLAHGVIGEKPRTASPMELLNISQPPI